MSIDVQNGALINGVRERNVDPERQARLAEIWKRLNLSGAGAIADALETTVRPYELGVVRDYREYWNLRRNGVVEGGTFTLNSGAIPFYEARAAAYLGVADPTDEQVRSYARTQFEELSRRFDEIFGAGWQARPEFQAYDEGFTYTAPPEKVAELTHGAEWLPSQLTYVISQNALLPASDTQIETQDPNIRGRNVTLKATGIGSLAEPMVIQLPTTPGATVQLTDAEKAALAAASLPGDVTIGFADGKPVSITVVQTRSIFAAAAETIDVVTSGDAFLQTPGSFAVKRLQAGGDIRLIANGSITHAAGAQAAITGGRNLALEAGTGTIGIAGAPLIINLAGVLGSARASDGLFLTKSAGDLVFDEIVSNGPVVLRVPSGGIRTARSTTSILATGGLVLEVSGNVQSSGGALVFEMGTNGVLSGDIGGVATLSSPTAGIVIADLRVGAALNLSVNGATVTGVVESGSTLTVQSAGAVALGPSGVLRSTGSNVLVTAGGAFSMAGAARVQAPAGAVAVSAGGAIAVSNVEAGSFISFSAGQAITQVGGIVRTTTGILYTRSTGGQSLTGTAVASFDAHNKGGGEISLVNLSLNLRLQGVVQESPGDVSITNTGNIGVVHVSAAGGTVRLSTVSSIEAEPGVTGPHIVAASVVLTSSSVLSATTIGAGAGGPLAVDSSVGGEGTVTASAPGTISLVETAGDLRLDRVRSTVGSVRLVADGSILAATAASPDVAGASIHLESQRGGIGSAGVPVVIDSALQGTGAVTVRAHGDVHLEEAQGDLRLESLVSETGDAFVAAAGAILRAQAAGANVLARNLTFTALGGGIGTAGEALLIDSASSAPGTVRATALGSIILTEVAGDLDAGRIESQAGDVVLVVDGSLRRASDSGAPESANVSGTNLVLTALNGTVGAVGEALVVDSSAAGSGVVTATARGDVVVTEAAGDLNAKEIRSQFGNVVLVVDGSLLNGRSETDAGANVAGTSLTLTATHGSIGTLQRALTVDSSFAGSGAVTATAHGDTALTEFDGDLMVNEIRSQAGDVVLIAGRSLLNAKGGGDTGANAVGRNVALTALDGTIGTLARALVIDSSFAGTGIVTAAAVGDVLLTETVGDLYANEIRSQAGDMVLVVDGSLLNAKGDADPGANVIGTNLTLTATNGTIGTLERALAIDSSYAGAGAVTAAALADVYLWEVAGDLNLKEVGSATGDVALTADGAILSAMPGLLNVRGNNLTLAAGARIGTEAAWLRIDSSYAADGVLRATGNGDIYLEEVEGDLHVYQVLSGNAGDLWLTAGGAMYNWAPERLINLWARDIHVRTVRGKLGESRDPLLALYSGGVDVSAGAPGPHVMRIRYDVWERTMHRFYALYEENLDSLDPNDPTKGPSGPGFGNGFGNGGGFGVGSGSGNEFVNVLGDRSGDGNGGGIRNENGGSGGESGSGNMSEGEDENQNEPEGENEDESCSEYGSDEGNCEGSGDDLAGGGESNRDSENGNAAGNATATGRVSVSENGNGKGNVNGNN